MHIETTRHNLYSYLRQTGEIVPGIVADNDYVWTFEPNKPFMAMPEVEMFILSLTEQCNLRCKYCCYSGDYQSNRIHSNLCMNGDDIEEIYDFIDNMTSIHPLHIAFYGGEPLTQYELMRYAIAKAEERWGTEVVFSVTTNAALLSAEKIDWLMAHHVKLEISIDGTAKFHDRNRVDQSGKGSFHRVYQVLSYIVNERQEYLTNVQLLMTLPSVEDLTAIAEYWNDDDVLRRLSPSHITGLAPNFAKGVKRKEYESLKEQYLALLDVYEQHQDWMVLKTYFDECIAYWIDRPIVDAGKSVPMSTCMPRNTKLYIDANKEIAVCEKISDSYRIGSIQEGIDWNKANLHVNTYYNKRIQRCSKCPAIRVCDLCLTAIEFNDKQWDVLCHNERVYAQLYMLLFCEMAERGMLTKPSVPTLQSAHCTLNEIKENDIAALRVIFSDTDTQRYLPDLCDIAQTDDSIKQILKSFRTYLSKNEGILWGIRKHDTLIGFVATMDLSTNPTIFFAMHTKYRNQGYMQESVRLATQYIRDAKLTNEIHTEVDVNNIASQKVLEHCGYKVQKNKIPNISNNNKKYNVIMKKTIFIVLSVICMTGLPSCKGSGGKKAATEAVEFIEKKAGSIERNAGRLEREAIVIEEDANKASQSAEEEYNNYNRYRKAKKWKERIENSFEDEEDVETTPQSTTVACPNCQGKGMVYSTDMYGNVIFDYYGNPQVVYCPQCGGKGAMVTYQ